MKSPRSRRVIFVACGVAVLLASILGGYYLGAQQQAQEVDRLRSERIEREGEYGEALSKISQERDRTGVDYQTACIEYQLLRSAYEKLYESSDKTTERYVSPDEARGNENSCYR